MAKFQEGVSGNPNGRPKGALNKSTKLAKEVLANFINDTSDEIPPLWREVCEQDPAEAIKLWTNIAEFVIPKHQRVQHSGDDEAPPINIIVNKEL